MVAMFHAVNMCFDDDTFQGYRGDKESSEYKNKIVERTISALSGHLLCLSDRPIDIVGIIANTAIERLFAFDVNSFVDDVKEREVPNWLYEEDGTIDGEAVGVDLDSTDAVHGWIRDEAPSFRGRRKDDRAYCEVWGRAKAAKAVFVSKRSIAYDHCKEDIAMGEHLAAELGVPLVLVDRYTRINEITIN